MSPVYRTNAPDLGHNPFMAPLPGRAGWLTRWATTPPVQAGIAGASWSIAGTFARGLLPRSPVQQAVASGVVAATHYQLTATAWASLQALGARPGQRPTLRANLVIAGAGIAGGLAASVIGNKQAEDSMPAAAVAMAGRITAFAALAGGSAAVWDEVLHRRLGLRPGIDTTLVPSIATAAVVVSSSVLARTQRAAKYGIVAPERSAVDGTGLPAALRAGGVGLAAGVTFAAVTTGEQLLAHGLERGLARLTGHDLGALGSVAAHGAILSGMGAAAIVGLNEVTARIERRDDIVEPAYPVPPVSPHVSSGPSSTMPFSSLGKEGRRFVLMALPSDSITRVMGQPAIDPVRIVGGYESSADIAERAQLILTDMEDCGAYDRALICVGVPTGVGYFNYTLAEAIEYLTLGDCAIVVPQYALVPSALALRRTAQAEQLTRLVLEGIRDRIASMPPGAKPRIALMGESLGANVALDIATTATGHASIPALHALGVSAGLYLGVPFRTHLWNEWRADPERVDPYGQLLLVSQPDEAPVLADGEGRQLMIVHHDDPVNKYSFRMVLQPPWWMGRPSSRPPLVPRESKFRPITSFVLATVDLLNGMNSRPGTFVRRGHDYRIDIRLGVERSLGMSSTVQQAVEIEEALRQREQQWATRRMVARKLDRARRSIERQLAEWGTTDISIADLDPTGAEPNSALARLGLISGPPGS